MASYRKMDCITIFVFDGQRKKGKRDTKDRDVRFVIVIRGTNHKSHPHAARLQELDVMDLNGHSMKRFHFNHIQKRKTRKYQKKYQHNPIRLLTRTCVSHGAIIHH